MGDRPAVAAHPTPWEAFRGRPGWVQALAWLVLPPLPPALWAVSEPRRRRVPAWAFVVLVFVAWVAGVGFVKGEAAGGGDPAAGAPVTATSVPPTSTTARPTTSSSTSSTSSPATTLPAGATTGGVDAPTVSDAASLVDRLAVAPEVGDDAYDRDLFGGGWVDADRDGCDTRDEVLVAESLSPPQIDPFGCHVVAGDWVSSYDGRTVHDPAELEIDHVVALAEAWRSGASTWPAERRLAYANDVDDPDTLIAVSAASNAAKSDHDPSSWVPSNPADRCRFATAWVSVKARWGLTADASEADALRAVLSGC